MKKIVLISFSIFFGLYTQAQKQAKLPSYLLNKTEKMIKVQRETDLPVIVKPSNSLLIPKPSKNLGTLIGTTFYDLQSNSSNGNRLMNYPDGNILAVWSMSLFDTIQWSDKGTGYNKSTDRGLGWLDEPTTRIEGTLKTTCPNIGKLANGAEIVVSNTSNKGILSKTTDGGLHWINTDIGDTILGLNYTRMLTNGNTIHIIGCTAANTPYQGFAQGALVYMKSTDGGNNWSEPIVPSGLDTSNYVSSTFFCDKYSFAGKGDTLAIVYGDAFKTTCLVKSTNDGISWFYREIIQLPSSVKKFDTEGTAIFDINGDELQDNIYGNDGCNFVTLDGFGKAHVFFGRMKNTDDDGGAGYDYFPYTDGLYYWNEDMNTINYQYKWTNIDGIMTYEGIPDTVNFPIITQVRDINGNDTIDLPDNGTQLSIGAYYCSMSSQPNAIVKSDGEIDLYYSSIVEGTDGVIGAEHKAFRNIFTIKHFIGTPDWTTPIRYFVSNFIEEVYPCVSPKPIKNNICLRSIIWYQADNYPGISQQPIIGNLHPIVENSIYYAEEPYVDGCDIGINEISDIKNEPIIYPNPAKDKITVSIKEKQSIAGLNLSIYNIQGQLLLQQNITQNKSEIAISQLLQGIYIAKIRMSDGSYRQKKFVVVK